MGICKLHSILPGRRIDIRCVNYSEFYTALIYFTGSKDTNLLLRNKANLLGYKLNEYNLLNINNQTLISIKSEKELFEILDIEYKEPNKR